MPATLTAVRRRSRGRVALEVDGRPWRVVPDDVVVRCGLAAGVPLERPLLRRIRTELLRARALEAGLRALERRDLSRARLEERLRRRRLGPAAEKEAVATLEEAGLVDDARLAHTRAQALAARGWGDAAVAARLRQEGLPDEAVRAALAGLSQEEERARAVAGSASDRRRAWGLLARRGFSPESAEAALGPLDGEA
ncbi:MAG: regulatory protein RecX [Gaiellaceae bacterium]